MRTLCGQEEKPEAAGEIRATPMDANCLIFFKEENGINNICYCYKQEEYKGKGNFIKTAQGSLYRLSMGSALDGCYIPVEKEQLVQSYSFFFFFASSSTVS